MQKPYITPSIINERGIKFFKESGIPIILGTNYFVNFKGLNKPSFVVDLFSKKAEEQEQIIQITLTDLNRLGFVLTSKRAGSKAWLSNQRVIYSLERKIERNPYSQKIRYVPNDHRIEKDINNNRVRIFGSNAGKGGAGHWMDIK